MCDIFKRLKNHTRITFVFHCLLFSFFFVLNPDIKVEKIFQTDIFLSWLSPDGSLTFDTTTAVGSRGGSGESVAVAQLVERPYKGPLRMCN